MEALIRLMTEYYHAGNPDRETNPEYRAEDIETANWAVSKAFAKNANATEALNEALSNEAFFSAARDYLNGWWEYFGDGGLDELEPKKPYVVVREFNAIRPYRATLRYLSVIAMYQ